MTLLRFENSSKEESSVSIQEHYENKVGEKATYRKDSVDYHTLRYVRWLEARLAEEIKWGHRDCAHGICMSSGTDCPVNSIEVTPNAQRTKQTN